ncbi:hypothetical protein Pse7367_3003 [Thalassoporum mexicanum PCC 7367]|uniref:T3SS (YopN, CesT) and YbjN peptide-binding chaperone 1 n=1 Tax=Thalassoporum mexicanum TaxID=3457544 RepID=UPI00029F9C3D|nr:hypothetical protein [Pseudanabaena sp. PCC 7367]AFY71253.1 hypothetical protein Pse7367_3003 [Pseudanabaena sp. PCC 7367]
MVAIVTKPEIEFTSKAQSVAYKKVFDYLSGSKLFQNSVRADHVQPKFDLLHDGTMVEVEVLPWEKNPWDHNNLAVVRAQSYITIGSAMQAELMQFLLSENSKMRFGAFHLDDANQVVFAESILGGENMDMMELQTCILSVVTIARNYDDLLVGKFGGQSAIADKVTQSA